MWRQYLGKRHLRKVICLTVAAALATSPLSAWPRADAANVSSPITTDRATEHVDLKEITRIAKEFGQAQNAAARKVLPQDVQGSFTVPTGVDATGHTVRSTLNPKDLLPAEKPAAGIRYGTTLKDLNQSASVYDGDALSIGQSMDDASEKKKEALYAETQGTGKATVEGGAYALVLEQYHRDRPDMSGEVWLAKSVEIAQNIDKYRDNLGTCKQDTTMGGQTVTGHVPDYRQCTQVLDLSGACQVVHRYEAGIL